MVSTILITSSLQTNALKLREVNRLFQSYTANCKSGTTLLWFHNSCPSAIHSVTLMALEKSFQSSPLKKFWKEPDSLVQWYSPTYFFLGAQWERPTENQNWKGSNRCFLPRNKGEGGKEDYKFWKKVREGNHGSVKGTLSRTKVRRRKVYEQRRESTTVFQRKRRICL